VRQPMKGQPAPNARTLNWGTSTLRATTNFLTKGRKIDQIQIQILNKFQRMFRRCCSVHFYESALCT
jgi:hypothetical protein